jgi:type IV pilus assembly protein PilW
MHADIIRKSNQAGNSSLQAGFTLIELMIAILISGFVIAAISGFVNDMLYHSTQQVQVTTVHQNLRGSLAIVNRDMRAAGMDQSMSGQFTITDVRRYSITAPGTVAQPDPNGSPALFFSADLNNNGVRDPGETVGFLLFDNDNNNRLELARSTDMAGDPLDGGRQLVAEGIEAIGITYAFDADNDGWLDMDNGEIVWAEDLDNDNYLDAVVNGSTIRVSPDKIRAVRISILARTKHSDRKFVNTHQYSVGNNQVGPFNDNIRRWLLTETVYSRNL